MDQRRQQLVQDLMLVIVSVCIAVLLTITGVAEKFVLSLNNFSWSGMILAGIFFTSIFTVAPSIVLIGGFAQASYLPVLAILGGVGAVVGDYIIFRFVKDRVSEDFKYLFSIISYFGF